MSAYRVREAGDSALVLELEDVIDPAVNATALAIARRIERGAFDGVTDVVPTYRTVAVHFDPLVADVDALQTALLVPDEGANDIVPGRLLEVPVRYGGPDGPDLEAVAAFAGLSTGEVIARHSQVEYRVYMLGFMPGFAYMGLVDERIAAPRHATPRLRVPAGAVGIAGRQTGVYPVESPGGWQIIGRTGIRAFDAARAAPAFFSPGDRVRFVPDTLERSPSVMAGKGTEDAADVPPSAARHVTVTRPGLFTTVQDEGRKGHQSSGVQVAGALDLHAHRLANALVGNESSDATLEATVAGPELVIEGPTTIGIAGGELGASLDDQPVAPGEIGVCARRSVLRFNGRRAGARTYIAFSGGIASPLVLGSRATHVRSGLGGIDGRALRAGDRIPLGSPPVHGARVRRGRLDRVDAAGGARLRVLPGPHDHWFAPGALDQLLSTRFTVSPQSDRMGYRLTSERALRGLLDREMISDATVTGALQVPPSGEPILLMADRQTTGGYPQIAVVITADLSRAAQLVPGDWVEFERCSRTEAVELLARQRRRALDG